MAATAGAVTTVVSIAADGNHLTADVEVVASVVGKVAESAPALDVAAGQAEMAKGDKKIAGVVPMVAAAAKAGGGEDAAGVPQSTAAAPPARVAPRATRTRLFTFPGRRGWC